MTTVASKKRVRFRPVAFYATAKQIREMSSAWVSNTSVGGWYFFGDYTRVTLMGPYATVDEANKMIERKFGKAKE